MSEPRSSNSVSQSDLLVPDTPEVASVVDLETDAVAKSTGDRCCSIKREVCQILQQNGLLRNGILQIQPGGGDVIAALQQIVKLVGYGECCEGGSGKELLTNSATYETGGASSVEATSTANARNELHAGNAHTSSVNASSKNDPSNANTNNTKTIDRSTKNATDPLTTEQLYPIAAENIARAIGGTETTTDTPVAENSYCLRLISGTELRISRAEVHAANDAHRIALEKEKRGKPGLHREKEGVKRKPEGEKERKPGVEKETQNEEETRTPEESENEGEFRKTSEEDSDGGTVGEGVVSKGVGVGKVTSSSNSSVSATPNITNQTNDVQKTQINATDTASSVRTPTDTVIQDVGVEESTLINAGVLKSLVFRELNRDIHAQRPIPLEEIVELVHSTSAQVFAAEDSISEKELLLPNSEEHITVVIKHYPRLLSFHQMLEPWVLLARNRFVSAEGDGAGDRAEWETRTELLEQLQNGVGMGETNLPEQRRRMLDEKLSKHYTLYRFADYLLPDSKAKMERDDIKNMIHFLNHHRALCQSSTNYIISAWQTQPAEFNDSLQVTVTIVCATIAHLLHTRDYIRDDLWTSFRFSLSCRRQIVTNLFSLLEILLEILERNPNLMNIWHGRNDFVRDFIHCKNIDVDGDNENNADGDDDDDDDFIPEETLIALLEGATGRPALDRDGDDQGEDAGGSQGIRIQWNMSVHVRVLLVLYSALNKKPRTWEEPTILGDMQSWEFEFGEEEKWLQLIIRMFSMLKKVPKSQRSVEMGQLMWRVEPVEIRLRAWRFPQNINRYAVILQRDRDLIRALQEVVDAQDDDGDRSGSSDVVSS